MTEYAYCPRCDNGYSADSIAGVLALVRGHLVKADDELHEGALEEWDDGA